MSDSIAVIPIKDVNEHTLITQVIMPMMKALESKLAANIEAVEPFWERKWASPHESKHSQDRVMVKRYLQRLNIGIQSLTGSRVEDGGISSNRFDDFLKHMSKGLKMQMCDTQYRQAMKGRTNTFSFHAPPKRDGTWNPESLYYTSPFTLIKPQLKSNYTQEADFLNATEVLTITKLPPTMDGLFVINNNYWKKINWNELYSHLNLRWNEAFEKYGDNASLRDFDDKENPLLPNPIRIINVYKLVQIKDDLDDPYCDYEDRNSHSEAIQDVIFRLSFAAIPTDEGYRIAPAEFTYQVATPALEFSHFINRLNNFNVTLDLINNYPAQGLFNWKNL
tara:strand:- start:15516 stop:16520 length:1005 start_codon:yes stop_codon:yes gene_type:complete